MYESGAGSGTIGVGVDDLVSGEAVALDLPPANIGLRVLSGLIDIIAGTALWFALRYAGTALAGDTDTAMLVATLTLATIVALVAFPTAMETATRGKTLGHLALGLRTVRDDAGPISFRHAVTRALLGSVELYGCLGFPALAASVVNTKGKRLGDLLAGTYVIRDRYTLKMPQPVPMPPYLEPWARTADIATLPPQLTLGIRQYFARRFSLTPSSRAVVLQRLVVETGRYVAPPPPRGTPGEDLLAAVLAERRRRDTERIARENMLRQRLLG
ncbi:MULTISPECIES: RDD family protein [Gordonia]|nr:MULTISPECIES: RDD family protein [Gordonia]